MAIIELDENAAGTPQLAALGIGAEGGRVVTTITQPDRDELRVVGPDADLADIDLLFIVTSLEGGAETSAALHAANAARERGVLTVGCVSFPPLSTDREQLRAVAFGASMLREQVDTTLVIHDSAQALDAVRGISDALTRFGFICFDLADVRTLLTSTNAGYALTATGRARGEQAVCEATRRALDSPAFRCGELQEAGGGLLTITGDARLETSLSEIHEAACLVQDQLDDEALFTFTSVVSEDARGACATITATGYDMLALLERARAVCAQGPLSRAQRSLSVVNAAGGM